MSAGTLPLFVVTPVTWPSACSMPVTAVCSRYWTPALLVLSMSSCVARAASARPSLGMCSPPRIMLLFKPGYSSWHSSELTRRASMPQDWAYPCFLLSSSRRSCVVAISRPPSWLKQFCPSFLSDCSFSIVYLANRVIVFEGFVWNTRPGACDVEPPGMLSGPCSMTVTSLQPLETNSSARFVPTMPAPMITTRCDFAIVKEEK